MPGNPIFQGVIQPPKKFVQLPIFPKKGSFSLILSPSGFFLRHMSRDLPPPQAATEVKTQKAQRSGGEIDRA